MTLDKEIICSAKLEVSSIAVSLTCVHTLQLAANILKFFVKTCSLHLHILRRNVSGQVYKCINLKKILQMSEITNVVSII